MNRYPITIALLLVLMGALSADEVTGVRKAATAANPSQQSQYLICVSEYAIEQDIPTDLCETEILDLIRKSKTGPMETVRVTAVERTESSFVFGRRLNITTAKVAHGNATSRRTETVEIGTTFRIQITSHPDGVLADVDFSTARLNGDPHDDAPPEIVTSTAQSTQIYQLGKERLLATSSTQGTRCIVISVREIP